MKVLTWIQKYFYIVVFASLVVTSCAPQVAATSTIEDPSPYLSLKVSDESGNVLSSYTYSGYANYILPGERECKPTNKLEVIEWYEIATWDRFHCQWYIWDDNGVYYVDFQRNPIDVTDSYRFGGMLELDDAVILDDDGEVILENQTGQVAAEMIKYVGDRDFRCSGCEKNPLFVRYYYDNAWYEGWVSIKDFTPFSRFAPGFWNIELVSSYLINSVLGIYDYTGKNTVYYAKEQPDKCDPSEIIEVTPSQLAIWDPAYCHWDIVGPSGIVQSNEWDNDSILGTIDLLTDPMVNLSGVKLDYLTTAVPYDAEVIVYNSNLPKPLYVRINGGVYDGTFGWVSIHSFYRNEFFRQ